MPITLDGTNGITTPTYGGADTSEYLVPVTAFKNRIINGAMLIDQRNAGASVTITNVSGNTYTLDRWAVYGSVTSKFSIQQNAGSVTPPVGYTNYLGATSLSSYSVGAGEYYYLAQYIEGFNCADLGFGTANASTVTVSFWVRSSITGTFSGSLTNSAFNRSYPFTYTVNASNTWEQKSVTIAGDTTGTWLTNNGTGLAVYFDIGSGANNRGTAGLWTGAGRVGVTSSQSIIATNGATFYITGVQLEVGSTATSFDYRPYGTELALCQRYYEKSYAQATAVPTNSQVGYVTCALGSTTYFGGSTGDISQNLNTVFFKVTKRTTATITTYSYASSTTSMAGNGWTGADLAAGTATISSPDANGFTVYNASGANRTVNPGAVIFHFAASAEL